VEARRRGGGAVEARRRGGWRRGCGCGRGGLSLKRLTPRAQQRSPQVTHKARPPPLLKPPAPSADGGASQQSSPSSAERASSGDSAAATTQGHPKTVPFAVQLSAVVLPLSTDGTLVLILIVSTAYLRGP
jgi:hypothetical protein